MILHLSGTGLALFLFHHGLFLCLQGRCDLDRWLQGLFHPRPRSPKPLKVLLGPLPSWSILIGENLTGSNCMCCTRASWDDDVPEQNKSTLQGKRLRLLFHTQLYHSHDAMLARVLALTLYCLSVSVCLSVYFTPRAGAGAPRRVFLH